MIGNLRQLCFRLPAVCQFNTSAVFRQPYTPNDNPGVYRRLKVIKEDEADIDKADLDYDSFEELEMDFMQSEDMQREIASTMKSISKARQYRITERKHFRPPKEPSMLTWSEKEQIKSLYRNNPERWTLESLAESFPASPAIIKKILKNTWRPLNGERLKAHDLKVSENWVAFHQGRLQVHDCRLRAHLEKFEDRKDGVKVISDEEAAKVTEICLPKPKRTEFLSLVTSFKSENDTNKAETEPKEIQQLDKDLQNVKEIEDKNSLSLIDRSRANYTLEQFRKRLETEADNLSEVPEEILAIIRSKKPDAEVSSTKCNEASTFERYVAPSERFRPNAVVLQKRKRSVATLIDPDNLPNRIVIPEDKWKPGLVYKVNDSFYNDKGYFLYRVPGLKS